MGHTSNRRPFSLTRAVSSIGLAVAFALVAAACSPDIEPVDSDSIAGDPNASVTSEEAALSLKLKKQVTISRRPVLASQTSTTTSAPATTTTVAPNSTHPKAESTDTNLPASGSYIAQRTRMGIGNCPIYPRNNVFHADVRSLPKSSNSDQIIAAMGSAKVRGMTSVVWQGSRSGYPVNVVDSGIDPSVTFVKQGFLLRPESIGSFPMPANPRLEGDPTPAWDQHLLLFDKSTCKSHEMFLVRTPSRSFYRTWEADSAHTLDLTSNAIPNVASTVSAISLLAGLVRYEEVASGSIDHVLTVDFPKVSNRAPVWPAVRTDGQNSDPNAPRMGSWLRLKNVDLSKFGPTARVVIKALQTHGAIIKDSNTSDISINGENDSRWDDADMNTLAALTAADFEVVDPTPMMVSANSYEIR
ncbi:MAG: hypothetical protein KDB26_04675 [Microthrixaceae bacterium]|nr:hypothetical protein [Microthrixaceae bacterium]